MAVTVILAGLGGLFLGAMVGQAKFRRPLVGALIAGGCAIAIAFALAPGPSDVLAVDTLDDFDRRVLDADRPVLVDFYSDRCGPCRRLAPTIEKLAEEYEGRLRVVKVDVEDAPQIASQYGVRAIPDVALFIDGEITHRWTGNRPASHYRTVLDCLPDR